MKTVVKSLCGVGKNQITFDKVPLAQATEYAAEDADITLRLWQTARRGHAACKARRQHFENNKYFPIFPIFK